MSLVAAANASAATVVVVLIFSILLSLVSLSLQTVFGANENEPFLPFFFFKHKSYSES